MEFDLNQLPAANEPEQGSLISPISGNEFCKGN